MGILVTISGISTVIMLSIIIFFWVIAPAFFRETFPNDTSVEKYIKFGTWGFALSLSVFIVAWIINK